MVQFDFLQVGPRCPIAVFIREDVLSTWCICQLVALCGCMKTQGLLGLVQHVCFALSPVWVTSQHPPSLPTQSTLLTLL